MSFIKLNRDSFENTKIKNSFKVKFEKNDLNSYISDNNFDCKNLLYSSEITFDQIDPELLNINTGGLSNEQLLLKKVKTAQFFNITFDQSSSFKDIYDDKKDLVENHGLNNNNLKSINFKNTFDIRRESQEFIINSFSLSKLNTVKNSLYDYYDKDMSKDYYPEVNFGYCNYNSLNLFSQKADAGITHSNCIVYSNQYDASTLKNEIDFSNSFTVNFWLNVRKNSSNDRSCIIHIPEVISIYSIEKSDAILLYITTGDNANKLLNNDNFPNISLNQSADGCYLLSENNLTYNNWCNVNFSFFKNRSNSDEYRLLVHNDNVLQHSINIVINSSSPKSFNSFVCLGNKPEYEVNNVNNTNYEEIFYTFFGKKLDGSGLNGPFYKKDLSFGKNINYNDDQLNKDIEAIVNDDHNIIFNKDIENSSAFSGEIHDIKIYNSTLSQENIEYISKNNIQSIEEHKNLGLQFYIPMFYFPLFVKKEGLFNNSISNANLYYSNIYNPYYANSCGGLDISVENYLVDFVSFKKPNVIIHGEDINNIFGNKTNDVEQSLVTDNDYNKIKKGVFSADISIDNIELNTLNGQHLDTSLGSNFYRNSLILPCDNGIPIITFDVISNSLENNEISYQNISTNKIYNIDCTNCLSGFENITRDYRPVESNTALSYNIFEGDDSVVVNSYHDGLFDISNFIYHDTKVTSQSQVININESQIKKSIDTLSKSVKTNSNPVTRIYNDPNLFINEILLDEDVIYKKLPISYFDFNASSLNMFSVVYDLSKSYYNTKIKKKTFSIVDENVVGTNNNIKFKLSENGSGTLYRDDCLTKVAKWNYVGHIFYSEGILCINNPSLYYFGKKNFKIEMSAQSNLYVHETNVIINEGLINNSSNDTYNSNLRIDESSFNSEEPFVYISDVNLHDENLNVVAKARLAHPIPKKNTDNILIKLKMDY